MKLSFSSCPFIIADKSCSHRSYLYPDSEGRQILSKKQLDFLSDQIFTPRKIKVLKQAKRCKLWLHNLWREGRGSAQIQLIKGSTRFEPVIETAGV